MAFFLKKKLLQPKSKADLPLEMLYVCLDRGTGAQLLSLEHISQARYALKQVTGSPH